MPYDNPAARLHAILTQGLAVDKAMSCRQAWAEVLGFPVNDSPALFSALGKVLVLPDETTSLISRYYPLLASANEHWRSPLETAFFGQQLGGKWESFIQHINPYSVSQLATFSELLHVRLGTLMAENDAIANLNSSIDELITLVEAADLSPELKLHALRELMALRATLSEYRITGGMPAIRQAEAIVGHMHRDRGFLDFMTSHEVGKRALDTLNAVVGVLTIITAVSQIAAPTFVLLPK